MRTALIVCAVCLLSSPAFAQATDQPGSAMPVRGYVEGIGGLTFGTESSTMFAGEFGIDLSPTMEVYGSIGRMRNVTPSYVNDQLDLLDDLLFVLTGQTWNFNVTAPSTFAIGGVRMHVRNDGQMLPYVLGGVGFGSVNIKISEASLGDVTETMIGDGYFLRDDLKATKFMFEIGGGIELPVGPAYVDVGYRFGKFLGLEDANVSRAYAGIGMRFGR